MEQSEAPRPFSFTEFETLISGIELIYTLGRRISDAVGGQPCEYLIQEATMAFVKLMMSVQAFLRFIPSSKFHAQEVEFAVDLSSASVMARQVMEDAIAFFYLCEPNLAIGEKLFRALVWQLHGATETVESGDYILPEKTDAGLVDAQNLAKETLNKPPYAAMLEKIKKDRRGRIRKGRENHVLHDEEILSRRGIRLDTYRFWRKTLSNFAHFSTLSHRLMMQTTSDWTNSWRSFYTAASCVANFSAEAVAGFVETFPTTQPLLSAQEHAAIANLRSWIRSDS
jgi:hypothetical protein